MPEIVGRSKGVEQIMQNSNKQHLLVGLFVIISAVILVLVWLWFLTNNRNEYNLYNAVFNEPVDGITTSSTVKYNGVEVGHVQAVVLNEHNQHDVSLTLAIISTVPINRKTYASIKSQGVTGMSYVDLHLPESAIDNDILTPHNLPPYPEIATKPSLLYSLSEQAQSLTNNIHDISGQVKFLLNQQNINHMSHLLDNLDTISTALAARTNAMQKSIDTLADILDNVKENSDKLNTTFDNLSILTRSLAKTSDNANNLVLNVQNSTLQNINSVLLPNLNQTLINLNQSSYQLEQFLLMMNHSPTALIRGRYPNPPGPGETN